MGCAISIQSLHPPPPTAKATRIGPSREGIRSRSALPGFQDFVAAASRQRHGLHQREAVQPPFDRLQRRHHRRLARLAQERHVRRERLRVEVDARIRERGAQFTDERFEFRRRRRSPGPGNPVMLPVARLVENQRAASRSHRLGRMLDFFDTRVLDIAEKGEREVQIFCAHRTPAAHRVELARPMRELRAHRLVRPQREEQPHPRSTTASAAMPSPRPIAPSRSAVLALMLTWPRSISRSAARFATIAPVCDAILGACAMMVASTLATLKPAARIFLPTSRSRVRLFAFLYFGFVSGKCSPISPSAAAPSSASHIAWMSTSASEKPSSPFSKGITTPPTTSFRPATRACRSKPCPILTGLPPNHRRKRNDPTVGG